MMSLITFSIVGCAVLSYDRLSDNVPKGYVEFYSEGVTGLGGRVWTVHKNENGKEEQITGSVAYGGQRRRIAERPGSHTFIVKLGTAAEKVTIKVIEGMIIPVRVIINPISVKDGFPQSGGYYYHAQFNMGLRVENATPFGK